MEINVNEVKEIVESLPIGLYARRRVPCVLDTSSECSFYIPEKDEIHISYKGIEKGLSASIANEEDREMEIRANVYHELSHAILTPTNIFKFWSIKYNKPTSVINIFEDERIETILRDFYLDVDFRRSTLLENGGKINANTDNVDEAFFNLCRFRCCSNKDFLDKVTEIITNYKKVNSFSDLSYWDTDHRNQPYGDYLDKIYRLYKDFKCWFDNCNPSEEEKKENQNNADNIANSIMNMGSGNGVIEDIEGQGAKDNSTDTNNDNQSDTDNVAENNDDSQNNSTNATDTNTDETGNGASTAPINNVLSNVINTFIDNSLTATLENIIGQYNKKNSKGSSLCAYSGVINPRLANREDYRFFERSAQVNGNNRFGNFHLNLFIDNSGSFENNRLKVNTLIKSLEQIEKRNKTFSFSVIHCGNGLTETTKNNRFITADESTYANYDEVRNSLKKNTLPNSYNYNIVLYDGLCCNNRGNKNCFLPWDTSNTTLIIEHENYEKVKDFTSAHIVNVERNYAEHLTQEVVKALTLAFR